MTPPAIDVLVDVDPALCSRVDEDALVEATRQAVAAAHRDTALPWREATAGVRITTDEEIQVLNCQYRGVDRPTDVLSFAFVEGEHEALPSDMPVPLGEVIVSLPYAERQAEDLGHPLATELAWLVIHGTLQLLGYHHAGEVEAERMETLEQVALGALGITLG